MADLGNVLPSLAVGPNDRLHIAWASAYIMHPTYKVPLYVPAYSSANVDDVFHGVRQVGEGYRYASVRAPETGLAASAGTLHVVFTTYGPRDGSWVWCYSSTHGGNTFSQGVGVYDVPGQDALHFPLVAADKGNVIHVAWAAQRGDLWDIYYARSSDGGASFASPRRVNMTEF